MNEGVQDRYLTGRQRARLAWLMVGSVATAIVLTLVYCWLVATGPTSDFQSDLIALLAACVLSLPLLYALKQIYEKPTITWTAAVGSGLLIFSQFCNFVEEIDDIGFLAQIPMLQRSHPYNSPLQTAFLLTGLGLLLAAFYLCILEAERNKTRLSQRSRKLARHIAEQKEIEEALRKSEEKYRLMAENISDIVWTMDMERKFTYFSPSVETLLGYSVDEARTLDLSDLLAPKSYEIAINELNEALSAGTGLRQQIGRPLMAEYELCRKDGSSCVCETTTLFLRDDGGTPIGVIGVARDLTGRKQAEEKLRGYEFIVNNSQDFMNLIDRSYRYVAVSESYCQAHQKRRQDIVGKTVGEMWGAEIFNGTIRKYLDRCFEGETVNYQSWFEIETLGLSCFDVTYTPFLDSDGRATHAVVVSRNVTERKKAEEALRREKDLSDAMIDILPGVFYLFDDKGLFLRWNKNLELVTGRAPNEIAASTPLDLIAPDDRKALEEAIREVYRRGENAIEAELLTNEGKRAPYYFTGRRVLHDGRQCLIGVGMDIADRKRAEEERKRLETQVQQAQKLESLGVLAGGIAHDFNNLLVGVLGNADLALHSLSPVSPARNRVEEIETAAERAADLCRQMLAYSGKGKFVIEPLSLNDLVREMAHLLEVSVSKGVELRYHFMDDLPLIEADATQIRQIVMNLITNAAEAIGDRSGIVDVSTGAMECDSSYLSATWLNERLPEGTYVYLEVSDTGSGMDVETKERIFDPFFTTKFTGRGLGLAAVLGIVRGHNGAITVRSKPGNGTTFVVLLPGLDDRAVTIHSDSTDAIEWSGDATVLLVDDEETVRAVGSSILEERGFTVVTAENGREAVDVFKASADDISVVVLDLTMPQMDGEETFRALQEIREDVRVVLSSGYNEQEVIDRFAGRGLAGFVQKPYRMKNLVGKVVEALA